MRKIFAALLVIFSFSAQAQFMQIDVKDMNSDGRLAVQYYQNGEYDKAFVLLEKLYQKSNENYFSSYFATLLKLKKYDIAEKITRTQMVSFPDDDSFQIALGKLYQEKGDLPAANKIYTELINNLPNNEFTISGVANNFFRAGNLDLAIQTYNQGRKILKDNKIFSYELLSVYRFKKDKFLLSQEYLEALSHTPQLLEQAQYALASVFEEKVDYQNFQTNILKKIQKEPDADVFTQLLIWNYIQQKEFDMALRQLIAFDKRNKIDGETIFKTAGTFNDNGAYQTAIKAYQYLLSKGKETPYYLTSKIEILNTKYNILTFEKSNLVAIDSLAKDYELLITEFGKNSKTLFATKKLGNLQAYYLNQPKKAEKILEEALLLDGISNINKGIIKLDLGDIYILTNQPWEAFLVYEQVSKQYEGQVIGNEARYRSAKLSFYQGNFDYANSQCLILKTATSQLIANDALNLSLLISDNTQTPQDSSALKMYADADMLIFRKQPNFALKKLDSIAVIYPKNSLADAVLMSKAKILIKTADYEKATSILKKITTDFVDGIWTDDAIFNLATLYDQKLNNKEEAKIYYQKLITDYPGSMFTAEARKRFRTLRGDNDTENKDEATPKN